MNILEHLAGGLIPPEPVITITDPVLFNVCMAALAKNDVRYYINYLHINPADNSVTGSDGHMLATGKAVDCSQLRDKNSLLILPERRLPNGAHYAQINLNKRTITGVAEKPFTIPFGTAKAKYPDYSQLSNDIENIETNTFSFQPQYLRKLSKAAMTQFASLSAHQAKKKDGSKGAVFYKVNLHSSNIKSDYMAVIMSAAL